MQTAIFMVLTLESLEAWELGSPEAGNPGTPEAEPAVTPCFEASRLPGSQASGLRRYSYFFNNNVPFVPPNPNEFDSA